MKHTPESLKALYDYLDNTEIDQDIVHYVNTLITQIQISSRINQYRDIE